MLIMSVRFSTLTHRIQILAIASSLFSGIACLAADATRVANDSALHPPAGATVAIVEFSDLECPACAHVNPILEAAAAKYKIPWVRHDFLIPSHPWSPSAAIYARWFDTKGNRLGDLYRDAVFANQSSIYNVNVLTQFTENFARSHNTPLPFAIDPQNRLSAQVQADNDLGKRTGVVHTPTIFIVTAHSRGPRYIEVQNPDRDLYRTIDQALADTR